jgi:hypothetical protein
MILLCDAAPPRAGTPTIAVAGHSVGLWLYDLAIGSASRLVVPDTGILNPQHASARHD